MNLILLFPDDFIESSKRVRLLGRRLMHVRDVQQPAAGDRLCVGLAGGLIGSGTVCRIDRRVLEMEVNLNRPPPAALPVTVVLALPRPKAVKRVLIAASSMGVKRIYLLNCYRVEKSYWQSPLLREDRIREALILGLEQARDTLLPDVQLRRRFKPFVEDELPAIAKATRALAAHPGSAMVCPRHVSGPVTLAIGPEGGFIPYELEKLQACGFTPAHIGERILRVETAVPALLGRLF
jgi:16S rRNA (uracil1498-N3)-methyltransferase